MGVLGDKLASALEAKTNDINSFIWKGPKKENRTQDEINDLIQRLEPEVKFQLMSRFKVEPIKRKPFKKRTNEANCLMIERKAGEDRFLKKKRSIFERSANFKEMKNRKFLQQSALFKK